MIIYKITNLKNNKIYIGQTIRSLEKRWQEHLKAAHNNIELHLYEAIRTYGEDNFKIEIIDTAPTQDILDEKEKYWIQYYDTLDSKKGYNNIEGGDTNPMSNAQILEKHNHKMRTEEVRNKISSTMKKLRAENGFSEITRQKISEKLKGNQHGKGKSRPLSAIKTTAIAHYKKVYCLDLEGNKLKEFESIKSAAEWWNDNYFIPKRHPKTIMNKIKVSYEQDKYIDSLKWIYEEI